MVSPIRPIIPPQAKRNCRFVRFNCQGAIQRRPITTNVSPSSPIVVLDSGLGGLTVARAIRSLLPRDEIVYFGDTARLPYGSKSAETVTGFVKQIIAYLRPLHPKHVVIACNT